MATEEARELSANLREHVAALLFVDEKRGLSDLQRQVHGSFAHIQGLSSTSILSGF